MSSRLRNGHYGDYGVGLPVYPGVLARITRGSLSDPWRKAVPFVRIVFEGAEKALRRAG